MWIYADLCGFTKIESVIPKISKEMSAPQIDEEDQKIISEQMIKSNIIGSSSIEARVFGSVPSESNVYYCYQRKGLLPPDWFCTKYPKTDEFRSEKNQQYIIIYTTGLMICYSDKKSVREFIQSYKSKSFEVYFPKEKVPDFLIRVHLYLDPNINDSFQPGQKITDQFRE
jgi:hypothetical protein